MKQIVTGHFDSHQQAETTVRALEEASIAPKDVLILAQNLQRTEEIQGVVTSGVTRGAGVGAACGGFFGLLAILAFSWVPGLGALIVPGLPASSFITILNIATVAILSGGLIGALMGYGLTQYKALKYEISGRVGHCLLLVYTEDAKIPTVRKVLEHNGIKDLEVSVPAGNTQRFA
jgi:hypothetical protein